jgi:hypothetical protein
VTQSREAQDLTYSWCSGETIRAAFEAYSMIQNLLMKYARGFSPIPSPEAIIHGAEDVTRVGDARSKLYSTRLRNQLTCHPSAPYSQTGVPLSEANMKEEAVDRENTYVRENVRIVCPATQIMITDYPAGTKI